MFRPELLDAPGAVLYNAPESALMPAATTRVNRQSPARL